MTPTDIRAIAALHRKEIAGGFMSSLAPSLLEMVFAVIAGHPKCVLIVARDGATREICGFVTGTTNVASLYRAFVIRKGPRALWALLPSAFSPRKLRRILETLFYPSSTRRSTLPGPELLDIAVDSRYVGTGLAQRLFHAFARSLDELGIEAFKVGTGGGLLKAQRFYERLGATRTATIEAHRGERSIYYIYHCARTAAHSP